MDPVGLVNEILTLAYEALTVWEDVKSHKEKGKALCADVKFLLLEIRTMVEQDCVEVDGLIRLKSTMQKAIDVAVDCTKHWTYRVCFAKMILAELQEVKYGLEFFKSTFKIVLMNRRIEMIHQSDQEMEERKFLLRRLSGKRADREVEVATLKQEIKDELRAESVEKQKGLERIGADNFPDEVPILSRASPSGLLSPSPLYPPGLLIRPLRLATDLFVLNEIRNLTDKMSSVWEDAGPYRNRGKALSANVNFLYGAIETVIKEGKCVDETLMVRFRSTIQEAIAVANKCRRSFMRVLFPKNISAELQELHDDLITYMIAFSESLVREIIDNFPKTNLLGLGGGFGSVYKGMLDGN